MCGLRRSVGILCMVVVASCLAGCDKGNAAQQDPVASFKAFSEKFVSHLRGAVPKHELELKPTYAVDVQKTESLVSPYIGILRAQEWQALGWSDLTFKFASQDGKWVLKSAVAERFFESGRDSVPNFDILQGWTPGAKFLQQHFRAAEQAAQ